jgi:hypothetical protein
MPNKLDAVFQQRDTTNTRFVERVISGSGLIIQTNVAGVLVGSSTLQISSISGSSITASGLYIPPNGTLTATSASIKFMIGTASYALNATAGGTQLYTGSTYPITASYALNSIGGGGTTLYTGSTYPITASYATNGGTKLYTGSFYPITSSWSQYAITSSNLNPPGGLLVLKSASFQNLVVNTPDAPVTPNDPGIEGQMKFDNDFAYFYANGKWRRVAFSLW